mgnify:CR=1 FL=1
MVGNLHQIIEAGFVIAMNATFVLSAIYFVLTLAALVYRRFRPDCQPLPDWITYPSVTVQIPTYNELAALNCARCCLNFDYPADKLQILIGDDSNQPDIISAIDEFAQTHPRIQVCRRGSNHGYKPGNLNHMLKATTGEYLLILDSDFLPQRDFLRRLAAPVARDPSLAGVQAAWHVVNARQNCSALMGAGIVNVIHVVILPLLKRWAGACLFCGSAELVRKDLLVQHGGWTPGALTEDVDYSLRILSTGERILFLEDTLCSCEAPQTPQDLFRQQMRWAYGVMRAILKHGGGLLCSNLARKRAKAAVVCFCSGYLMVLLLLLSTLLGILYLTSMWIGIGMDSAQNAWVGLRDFVLTSGMLVASLCAGFITGFGRRSLGRLALASLTIGLVLLFFVSTGLAKAILGLPMNWFMLKKNGNQNQPVPVGAV